MDFVLLGFGIGALLILCGRAVRTYGPRAKRKDPESSVAFPVFVDAVRWGRVCRGSGLVMVCAGAFLCAITVVLLLASASDRLGMVIVALSVLAILLAAGTWAALFAHPEWRRSERVPRWPLPHGVPAEPLPVAHGDEARRLRSEAALAAWPEPRASQNAGEVSTAKSDTMVAEQAALTSSDHQAANGQSKPGGPDADQRQEHHDGGQPTHVSATLKTPQSVAPRVRKDKPRGTCAGGVGPPGV
ncbi:MAG TPA: hypothetical protein VGR16_02790 [Thermomicrobiales bacterium]|nr:hypothetical protein [Thermomicrobiales bacterium]